MHTLAAFFESITNGATLTEVNGVADQSLTMDTSNRIQVPGPWQLLGATAIGADLTRVQFNAPSFRRMILPEVYPNDDTGNVPTVAQPCLWRDYGPKFDAYDFFIPNVSRGGAGAANVTVLAWIGPQFVPAPVGPTYTLVGTVTPTLTAGTWVLANPVWDQQLPVGNYHVVGMYAVVNDATACRLVFPGGAQFRPGVLVNDGYGDITAGDPFRFGRFGSFGKFAYNAMPQIEVLGHTAGAEAVTVGLDLIKA